jgi:hypothetical protein
MQTFKAYLHDLSERGELREHMESQGVTLSDEAWDSIGRPFYEVTLECEVSDEGVVTLVSAKL